MSNKEYPEYMSTSLKSYDKTIIVEELLEKLKAQGCFDAKRKQFLSEITNKSTYQNLHTKVENLATKFLETVRWPPSVQKHQLREQLRLHIQSTDQFNNCVSRLIEQEVNCKIQGELKPMIESKACEYLEVNYEKWKQNMLSQIYENFQVESPVEKFTHKPDIKKEAVCNDLKSDLDIDVDVIHNSDNMIISKNIKLENTLSSINSVSTCNSNTQSVPKYTGISSHKSPQTLHSNYISATPPTMPPPIGLLPPPHRILPNNLFQPLPPPPPPMFLPMERFPPPPPPEDKSLPPPPPPENGPNTPTEEYVPKFNENIVETTVEKVKIGLLKTPEKAIDKAAEVKIFSPKKMIWGQIVLSIQDISDDSASDSDKNEHERRRYTRKSSHPPRNTNTGKAEGPTKHFDELRPKDSLRNQERSSRQTASYSRQKSNDYTDVSSESFNELEFKDAQPAAITQISNKKPVRSSSSEDSHSSSSNDQTLDLIRKINKKKIKMRKTTKTHTVVQSSSSYSSSESSTESSSSEHSQHKQITTNYRDVQRGYRVFGRSQSEEKDMDISVVTQSPIFDPKWTNHKPEINLDSVESVQMRKNQIKARLEEIDAKRSLLQKQQLLTSTEPGSVSNTASSSSTDSSSDNTTTTTASSSLNRNISKIRDKELKKSSDANSKLPPSSPNENSNIENEQSFNKLFKHESLCYEDLDSRMDQDSEPEEGELSSESRAGSMKRDNITDSPNMITTITENDLKSEPIKMECEEVIDKAIFNQENIS